MKNSIFLMLFLFFLNLHNVFAQCAPNIDKIAMDIYTQAAIGVGTFSNTSLPYGGFHKTFGIEYQSELMADCTFFSDNYNLIQRPTSEGLEDTEKAFEAQYNSTYVPVKVGISNTYDPSTRKVDITLTANFCDTASGDLRFYLVLTQDTVIGPVGIDYAQNIAMLPGSKWEGYTVVEYPNEIGAWVESYPFKDAVKYQPSGFFGNAGIIPKNPIIGTTYTEKYSFTLPKKNSTTEKIEIDPKRIRIVAAVVKKGVFQKRQALNANKKYLIAATVNSSDVVANSVNFTVYNPVCNELILHYSTVNEGIGALNIYNASGDVIKTIVGGHFRATPI